VNLDSIREYALSLPGAAESFPFDEETLVFKAGGKMFLLMDLSGERGINVKCDPEKATELREKYDTILPGYHMNKQNWNTILLHGHYGEKDIKGWITDSYHLIVNSLPKKVQAEIRP